MTNQCSVVTLQQAYLYILWAKNKSINISITSIKFQLAGIDGILKCYLFVVTNMLFVFIHVKSRKLQCTR